MAYRIVYSAWISDPKLHFSKRSKGKTPLHFQWENDLKGRLATGVFRKHSNPFELQWLEGQQRRTS